MSPENRWEVAIRRAAQQTADALAEVNAAYPFPRVPLRKRILWRIRGVPSEVRAEQLALRKARADLLARSLHERHRSTA